jgi:hypothetical protein
MDGFRMMNLQAGTSCLLCLRYLCSLMLAEEMETDAEMETETKMMALRSRRAFCPAQQQSFPLHRHWWYYHFLFYPPNANDQSVSAAVSGQAVRADPYQQATHMMDSK